jgi:WD40 repeat protein
LIYQGTHRVALGRAGASEICARFAETLEIIVPRAGQIIAENEVEWTAASLTSLTFGKMGQEIVLIAMTGRAYPSTCIIYRASDLKELTTFKGSDLELTRDLLKAGVLLETGARLGVSVFSVSAANPVLISPGDDELHIFDVESAKELCKLSGKQLSQNLRSAASTLLRGEQLIATAGIDGPIRLWKFASTSSTELIEARPPFLGHQAAVWRLSFGVVNGRPMLASGGMESPRIWDLATGQCLKIEIDHRVEDLVLSGSGLLAIGTKRGMITLQLSSAWVQNS